MSRFLLDTGPAQLFLNNDPKVRLSAERDRRHGHRIGICTPVLGELWSGVEGSHNREINLRRLRHGLSQLIRWPFDEKAAAEFGRLFMVLKRLARPMQQVDIQIAAIARTIGDCKVVTVDSDLLAIPGLDVLELENWTSG